MPDGQSVCSPELAKLAAKAASRVHPVFVAEGWEWSTHNPDDLQERAIPSRERIEARLREMLAELAERGEKCQTLSTGRFIVSREIDGAHVVYQVDLTAGTYLEELYP